MTASVSAAPVSVLDVSSAVLAHTAFEMGGIAEHRAALEETNAVVESKVTERTAALTMAHQELRTSEERFRTLSNSSPIGIVETDVAGNCLYTNPRWQSIAGLTLEEGLGEGWARALHPADAAAVVAALRRRFPGIIGPKKDDICYATQNRQDAVRLLGPQCDLVIVVGSPNSSNSNRLREVAARHGASAHMIDRAEEIRPEWLADKRRIGITAGASAPEVLVQEVIARLKTLGAANISELTGVVETIVFPMPRGLSGLKSETHASLQTPPGSASYPK